MMFLSTNIFEGTRDAGTSVTLRGGNVLWNNVVEGVAIVTTCTHASVPASFVIVQCIDW